MNYRIVASTLIVAAIAAIACVDMSVPEGPASISEIKLPSPSLIRGDTLRDSTGEVAPLRVVAYDAGNNIITGAVTVFFIPDSAPPARLGPNNTLIGDSVRLGNVNVIGQIGALQTPGVSIPVTRRPDTIIVTPADTIFAPLSGDTTQKGQGPIQVSVLSAKDSASQGIIVNYTLLHTPPSVDPGRFPAVYLSAENGNPSTVDTTDASGKAMRQVTVVSARLADSLLISGQKVDSAVVVVTVRYARENLGGSPDTVSLPIRIKP